jgi:hypothetical protein
MKTVSVEKSQTVSIGKYEELKLEGIMMFSNDTGEEVRWSDEPITKDNLGFRIGDNQIIEFSVPRDIYFRGRDGVTITATNKTF